MTDNSYYKTIEKLKKKRIELFNSKITTSNLYEELFPKNVETRESAIKKAESDRSDIEKLAILLHEFDLEINNEFKQDKTAEIDEKQEHIDKINSLLEKIESLISNVNWDNKKD